MSRKRKISTEMGCIVSAIPGVYAIRLDSDKVLFVKLFDGFRVGESTLKVYNFSTCNWDDTGMVVNLNSNPSRTLLTATKRWYKRESGKLNEESYFM